MTKTVLLIAIFAALFVAVLLLGVYLWSSTGDVPIGTNGYIALALAVVFTFGLGAGLMALVFYSARRGYDEIDGPSRRGEDDDATRR